MMNETLVFFSDGWGSTAELSISVDTVLFWSGSQEPRVIDCKISCGICIITGQRKEQKASGKAEAFKNSIVSDH